MSQARQQSRKAKKKKDERRWASLGYSSCPRSGSLVRTSSPSIIDALDAGTNDGECVPRFRAGDEFERSAVSPLPRLCLSQPRIPREATRSTGTCL